MPLRSKIWVQMFWAVCVYLALQFATFLLIKIIFRVAAERLVGPYFAFAIPGVVFQFLAMWLRDLEVRGASPKRLVLAWALAIELFFLAIVAALFYSVLKFQILNSTDAAWTFGLMVAGGSAAVSLAGYRPVLERISARAGRTPAS